MPILDFKEIAIASQGPDRDSFELFAREFLVLVGFKVLEGPDRGPDGGRDLLAEELRTGAAGETRIRWLVSCKHKAHSGASVSPTDEPDIHDRVTTHQCKGFLGIYSTLPSAGLSSKLTAPNLPYESVLYDQEKIERYLLKSPPGIKLAERFFPRSVELWKTTNPKPAKLFVQDPNLKCMYCDRSLLEKKAQGIVVSWSKYPPDDEHPGTQIEHMYWCCKGRCDTALETRYRTRTVGMIDAWEDIADLMLPTIFIRWVMAVFNELRSGVIYSDSAFAANKELLLNLFPHVCRHLTDEEQERVRELFSMPVF